MHDGQFKRIVISDDVEVGMIVREMHDDATVPPFADSVMLKRINRVGYSTAFIVARPYVFASGVGTTCPTPLTGVEAFEVSFESLRDRYVLVLDSRGNPFSYTT